MSDLEVKYQKLLDYLKGLESVAVAFSGGVDSTFLLAAAKEALGDCVNGKVLSFSGKRIRGSTTIL